MDHRGEVITTPSKLSTTRSGRRHTPRPTHSHHTTMTHHQVVDVNRPVHARGRKHERSDRREGCVVERARTAPRVQRQQRRGLPTHMRNNATSPHVGSVHFLPHTGAATQRGSRPRPRRQRRRQRWEHHPRQRKSDGASDSDIHGGHTATPNARSVWTKPRAHLQDGEEVDATVGAARQEDVAVERRAVQRVHVSNVRLVFEVDGVRKHLRAVRLGVEHDLHRDLQRSAAQRSATQHSTAQHSTAQHSTAQHSTAQHSTAHSSVTSTVRVRATTDAAVCTSRTPFSLANRSTCRMILKRSLCTRDGAG